jgi:hypothetical protein
MKKGKTIKYYSKVVLRIVFYGAKNGDDDDDDINHTNLFG